MEDHHVDRPEVEAEQSAQLTGTNRSIELDPKSRNPRPNPVRVQRQNPLSPHSGARGPGEGRGPERPHTKTLPFPHTRSHYKPPEQPPAELAPCSSQGQALAGTAGGPSGGQGLAGLVAMARGQTPDPIPNSAVKTLSADGTAAQAAEE